MYVPGPKLDEYYAIDKNHRKYKYDYACSLLIAKDYFWSVSKLRLLMMTSELLWIDELKVNKFLPEFNLSTRSWRLIYRCHYTFL